MPSPYSAVKTELAEVFFSLSELWTDIHPLFVLLCASNEALEQMEPVLAYVMISVHVPPCSGPPSCFLAGQPISSRCCFLFGCVAIVILLLIYWLASHIILIFDHWLDSHACFVSWWLDSHFKYCRSVVA